MGGDSLFKAMNYDKVNDIVRSKTGSLKSRLTSSIRGLNMKHVDSKSNYEPLTKISTRISMQRGLANRIRIKFKKSGIFIHKGVGRGTSAGQVGTTTRKAKEWFNPVVEEFADELMNAVADEMVDLTFNSIKIK